MSKRVRRAWTSDPAITVLLAHHSDTRVTHLTHGGGWEGGPWHSRSSTKQSRGILSLVEDSGPLKVGENHITNLTPRGEDAF